MLELRDVTFAYNRNQPPAVANVSLTIRRGEFVAIAGRNGSGKTTITKLMMSLLKPTHGQIFRDDEDTKSCTPADMARYIGYVFQNPDRQIFRDTVRQEISYGPEMLGFSSEKISEVTEQAMKLTGVADLADRYPRTLTRSQKQRVAIASALSMTPDFLILDEPTSGQDADTHERFMALLKDFHSSGKTIILVTHDMDCLVRYAERVIVMDKGIKLFDGSVTDCFADRRRLHEAGLREPATVSVSNGLAPQGISLTTDVASLAEQILAKRGGLNG
ncbi:ABC transporter [Anaerosporomusa subterranea]|uniref:ABC transporter n=1 Tax=Anaerosporomusa subterranea TaxID=1794912 RepID=A0A154BST5_ANASB|nr:ABC transporter ATP-binding protein [Anaerosporomusa subterranea]KYZ76890.1 ABC transporter [Anaerosporomusa subterranea]